MRHTFYLIPLLLALVTGACSVAPNTAWDHGDPFAKVRLLFDS